MMARHLEELLDQQFLLSFHGRNLGSWEEVGRLPLSEARYLCKRLSEELEKIHKANKRR